jgi:hypothetical protein
MAKTQHNVTFNKYFLWNASAVQLIKIYYQLTYYVITLIYTEIKPRAPSNSKSMRLNADFTPAMETMKIR